MNLILAPMLGLGPKPARLSRRTLAKIKIMGPIHGAGSGRMRLGFGVTPDSIAAKLQWVKTNRIRGIIFEIDSPGGSVVASKELADMVKATEAKTVAWVRDLGASGAYWLASACDRVVADPLSSVGSIGVLFPHLEFSGLMKKHGIGYEQFKAGAYKDMGIPFRKTTDKERKIIQERLDRVHEHFINQVSKNRNIKKSALRKLANGLAFHGEEALDAGLVDALGGRDQAIAELESLCGFKHKRVVDVEDMKEELLHAFRSFTALASTQFGEGLGRGLARAAAGFRPDLY